MSGPDGAFIGAALVWLIAGIPAVIFHEVAHGWMAAKLGDPTARRRGRLSINPLRHIDWFGTLVVPVLMLLFHMPFTFGWAKPVPVNYALTRRTSPRLAALLVALAGPVANLLMMLGWLTLGGCIAFVVEASPDISSVALEVLIEITLVGAATNLVLMLFNLIPILPLDGGRILASLLPDRLARPYMRLEHLGIPILLVLITSGSFGKFVETMLNHFYERFGLS